jgi:Ankyrin repeats (many copies)
MSGESRSTGQSTFSMNDEKEEMQTQCNNLFLSTSNGHLERVKSTLCLYEIETGTSFNLKIPNKEGVLLLHTAAYYGQVDVLGFFLSLEKSQEGKPDYLDVYEQEYGRGLQGPEPLLHEDEPLDESVLSEEPSTETGLSGESFEKESLGEESTASGGERSTGFSFSAPEVGPVKPKGALVNVRSPRDGATPMHYAVIGGNRNKVAEFLLREGADPRIVDNHGMTPRDLSLSHGHKTLAKFLGKVSVKCH